METSIKMDDLGVALFLETPIFIQRLFVNRGTTMTLDWNRCDYHRGAGSRVSSRTEIWKFFVCNVMYQLRNIS